MAVAAGTSALSGAGLAGGQGGGRTCVGCFAENEAAWVAAAGKETPRKIAVQNECNTDALMPLGWTWARARGCHEDT